MSQATGSDPHDEPDPQQPAEGRPAEGGPGGGATGLGGVGPGGSEPSTAGDDDSGEPAGTQPSGSRFWHAAREIAIVVVSALIISAVVRTFLMQAFWVPSGSMEQTLERGDRILVWKPSDDPGRGDVVVFKDPSDWLEDPLPPEGLGGVLNQVGTFVGLIPSSSGDDLVKRVVAVGGDTIACCTPEGQIIRNGEPLAEPYILPGDVTDQIEFDVAVPEGYVFVMGDHRSDSADSRYHLEDNDGLVPVENIVGRAVVVMWPISRWSTLPDYQDEAAAQAAHRQ